MQVKTEVTVERIADLLCNALEGGSNYWYVITDFVAPKKLTFKTHPPDVFRHIDYPCNVGGALEFRTLEDDEHNGKKRWMLDLPAMHRGLQLMAEKYPHHWRDFQAENDDATTGDVFLQLALFGDVIYG